MAAIICFRDENGRYLLVENRHRPEFFGPFGGVFKSHSGASRALSDIEFEPQEWVLSADRTDAKGDLRGFLPALQFPSFLTWFKERKDRELEDCLHRELREELVEAAVPPEIVDLSRELKFVLVRTIHEGPFGVKDHPFSQYRYFEVFTPRDEDSKIVDQLFKQSSADGSKMIAVSGAEIRSGRSSAKLAIATHASYLLGLRRFGQEPAPMVGIK